MLTPLFRLHKLKAVKRQLEDIANSEYLPLWSLGNIRAAILEIDAAIKENQALIKNN